MVLITFFSPSNINHCEEKIESTEGACKFVFPFSICFIREGSGGAPCHPHRIQFPRQHTSSRGVGDVSVQKGEERSKLPYP